MKHLQLMLKHFWSRWSKEYLTELREHHRVTNKKLNYVPIQVGDAVCIHQEKLPRKLWRLGRIERLLVGKDDHPRAAVVKVFGEGRQATFIERPVQKLYLVELTEKQITEDNCTRVRRRYAD